MNWIKCSDKLPELNDNYRTCVIVYGTPTCGTCGSKTQVMEAYYNRKGYFEFGEYDCGIDVSHWMPLPDAPRDEE